MDREFNRNPLFQVMFVLRTQESRDEPSSSALKVEPLETQHMHSRFDLSLELTQGPSGLDGFIEFSSDLFESSTIERLDDHLHAFLSKVVQSLTILSTHGITSHPPKGSSSSHGIKLKLNAPTIRFLHFSKQEPESIPNGPPSGSGTFV